ncbi:MAG: FAD-dependent monooxygenase [Pseudonocardiaceae bacterium]
MLPVVVCGAGPVGLVLALELAAWQVPVLLIDRHQLPLPFPRGRAISIRSMEIVRQLGLEQEVADIGLARVETAQFFAGSSLTAPEFGRIGSPPARAETAVSPTAALACPQDWFEELLRAKVVDHPLIDARFGTELRDADRHGDHVEVALRGSDGTETTLRTSWLVGADGSRSRVRHLAGISTDPLGCSCSNVNILIDADLTPLIRDRISLVYTISNDDLHATVLTVDNQRHWLINVVLPDGDQVDPTPPWCERMVRAAVGLDDLVFRVVAALRWEATARLARRYRHGRLLIIGDAAHVTTPHGGFGMNLGLADAHNLAWKLALCITGAAGDDLVDTYEQERRPIGEATVAESARQLAAARADHVTGRTRCGEVTPAPSDGLVLGRTYRSAAVQADGVPPPESVASYRPDAAPGCRAPHVWLPDGRSTLDLFGPWFTLLAGHSYGDSVALPYPVHRHRLDSSTRDAYGIADRGAVLVRPDGHIAWRLVNP